MFSLLEELELLVGKVVPGLKASKNVAKPYHLKPLIVLFGLLHLFVLGTVVAGPFIMGGQVKTVLECKVVATLEALVDATDVLEALALDFINYKADDALMVL